jgi:anti-sigma B factor antagonist
MTPNFDVNVVDRGDAVVLVVVGEVDVSTVPVLDDGLSRAEDSDAKTIVVDLDRVDFMDAAGVGVLARHEASDRSCHRLRLTSGSAAVRRLLAIPGLRARLPAAVGH